MELEIFVLNYNGSALLIECLPSIVEASKRSRHPCALTVIDNDSTDDSLELLKNNFRDVKVLRLKNRVLCSFNEAVHQSRADIVVLLNNDIKVEFDFLDPLVKVFEDRDDAFLAAPRAETFDGRRYEGGLSKLGFRHGFPWGMTRYPGYEKKIGLPGLTMAAGFGAFRRSIFLELGGFDDLYLPGTVEDTDLCFRAWKEGYRSYYAPQSRVYHKGQATFGKHFGSAKLLAINQRNLCLFVWKNVSDPALLLSHTILFFPRVFYFLLKGRPEFAWGNAWAFLRMPAALTRRFAQSGRPRRRTDREIFAVSEGL